MSIEIEITNHPTSADHRLVKVISRQRVYAATWAEPFPSMEDVAEAWQHDRRSFVPYDETTGRYLR